MKSELLNKFIDDMSSADKDKNYMVDEKEAMGFLLNWTQWILNQISIA